jgi:lauroyl/myristoyl acyltransferase
LASQPLESVTTVVFSNCSFIGENLSLKVITRFFLNLLNVFFSVLIFPLILFVSAIPLFPTMNLKNNVILRLGKTKFQAYVFCVRVYLNYLKYAFESAFVLPLRLSECVNFNEISQKLALIYEKNNCKDNKRGIAFLGAHFGHIECTGYLISKALATQNLPQMSVLAQPAKNKWVNKIVNLYRKICGLNVISTTKSDLAKNLVKACKNGSNLGLLIDQKPKQGGLFIEFFGKKAAFPYSGLRLCSTEKLTVVYTVAERISLGKFIIHLQEGVNSKNIECENLSKQEKVTLEIESYAKWLEGIILQAPHQWFWDYRKWSREEGLN